ncbi:hypothetical protein P3W85_29840 [Cupriavidus basilensis]|uniref:Phage protein n=1 Tax=Cupriavidus basilensis TaxID=68895 RepID=A0ABT6AWX6_9BURK|nr:hypothetical protein [Cupriavidus basilensis]MDF3837125.1 hypothetical protein [Cupriavidus basilensis]
MSTPASQRIKQVGTLPAFMLAGTGTIARLLEVSSQHYRQNAWAAPEYRLLAAIVAQWLNELCDLATKQQTDEGRLWPSGEAQRLLVHDRPSIEAMLSWLGVHPDWIDRVLATLGLTFIRTEKEAA